MAAIVALVVQVVWHLVRSVLEQSGAATHSGYVASLAFSVTAATDLVIVAALADLARRLTGARKIGAVIAVVAYFAIAASTIANEGLIYRAGDAHGVQWWVFMMRDYGWYTLDSIAIIGFTIAAGRRAAWLAPIAVGAAIFGGRPALQPASVQFVSIVFVAIRVALLVVFALEAERHATTAAMSRDRAVRGIRRLELMAWIGVALIVIEVPSMLSPSMYSALPIAIMLIVAELVLALAAWSIAQARIPNMSRWLWYLSAICNAWAAARLVRAWFMTVTRYWGRFAEVPLAVSHWSTAVPATLASLTALVAYALYARRMKTPRLALVSLAAVCLLAIGFAIQVFAREDFVVSSACGFVVAIMTARICAVTRTAVEGELPRARVVG